MSINTSDTVESGHYLYCHADWSIYSGGVKTGELVHTSIFIRGLMKIEDECYE